MFAEISRHILDICRNSADAGADLTVIKINCKAGMLAVEISDNGKGVSKNEIERLLSPFYTTRISGKTGLGLPLFKQAALAANGSFETGCLPDGGMYVRAEFDTGSPDCMPLGSLKEDISAFVLCENAPDVVFEFESDNAKLEFDTRRVKSKENGDNLSVWQYIRDYLGRHEKALEISSYGRNFFRNKEENNEN